MVVGNLDDIIEDHELKEVEKHCASLCEEFRTLHICNMYEKVISFSYYLGLPVCILPTCFILRCITLYTNYILWI